MSSYPTLIVLQRWLTRYGMTTYMTLGNLGLLLNIIIFTRSTHRHNPCSLYICAVSICSLIGMNISLVPNIYALDHPNPLANSLLFCQLQFYLLHIFNQSMRTFVVIACADRYATCSGRAKIRSFSRYRIAIRVIPSVLVFWIIIAVFPVMMRSLVNGVCDALNGVYNIIYSVYILIVLSTFPLVGMITFGILLIRNLKDMRTRIQPGTNTNIPMNAHSLRRRDRDMMRMLLIEVLFYVITTIPITIALIYKSATQSVIKSTERQQIETFLYYFTRLFLLYLNNSVSFWIYITTSKSYRTEFKKLITEWYNIIKRKLL